MSSNLCKLKTIQSSILKRLTGHGAQQWEEKDFLLTLRCHSRVKRLPACSLLRNENMNNLENNEIQEELSNPPLSLLGFLACLGLVFWLTGIVSDIASVPLGSLTLLKIAKLLVSVVGIVICLRIAWVCYGLLSETLSGIKRQQPRHIYITALFVTFVITPLIIVLIYSAVWVDWSEPL